LRRFSIFFSTSSGIWRRLGVDFLGVDYVDLYLCDKGIATGTIWISFESASSWRTIGRTWLVQPKVAGYFCDDWLWLPGAAWDFLHVRPPEDCRLIRITNIAGGLNPDNRFLKSQVRETVSAFPAQDT
jgi:hypothetical protein